MRTTAFVAVLATAARHVAATFSTTGCSVFSLSGRETLTTECETWNPDKGKVLYSLDLNTCIGIKPGPNAMIWEPNGNAFAFHCDNCGLQNSTQVFLECDCVDPRTGDKTISSINLDFGITNLRDGTLTCI